jgi:hypothetical protein
MRSISPESVCRIPLEFRLNVSFTAELEERGILVDGECRKSVTAAPMPIAFGESNGPPARHLFGDLPYPGESASRRFAG